MTNTSAALARVLVTGGAGLIGNELIGQLLSAGKNVTAIYNRTPINIKDNNLKIIPCDILDVTALEEVMEGIDELYHCAGLVSFDPGKETHLYKINVEGTANVVNAALNANVRKMLHVSSAAALGSIRENELMDESMQWSEAFRNSKYGQSKYLGEMEVWRGIAEGLNAVIINPTIVLGAGDWNEGSTELFKSVYKEFPWYTEGTTGFVDVKDVANAMISLMGSDISAERFIISAENRSYRELFNLIADGFNKKRPFKKGSRLIAGMVWRIEAIKSKFSGQGPLVTKETAATAFAKARFDNSKLKKFLPSFEYQNLERSVQSICNALQQKLNIR